MTKLLAIATTLIAANAVAQILPGPSDYPFSSQIAPGFPVFGTPNSYSTGNFSVGTDGGTLYVDRSIEAIQPAPQAPTTYPLGNDIWVSAKGTADLHLQNWTLNVTGQTFVDGGLVTVSVDTGRLCPSTSPVGCTAYSGPTTAKFCPPGTCILLVDEDTANYEFINPPNWVLVDNDNISAIFTKQHTPPFNIRQTGQSYFDTRSIGMNAGDVSDRPLAFTDRGNNISLFAPNDVLGTWPLSAWRFPGQLTGASGGSLSFVVRDNTASSCLQQVNSANGFTLINSCENAGSGFISENLVLGNNVSSASLQLLANPDVGRLIGGGGNGDGGTPGIQVWTSGQTGAGRSKQGTFRVMDNNSANINLEMDTFTNAFRLPYGQIRSGSASATDMVGLITLTGGSGSYSFTGAYSTAPVCFFADRTTHANTFTWAVSTSAITISAGTGTDVIQYVCLGMN